MSKGAPAQRGPLLFDDDFTFVVKYGSEYRGFVQYNLLAQDALSQRIAIVAVGLHTVYQGDVCTLLRYVF